MVEYIYNAIRATAGQPIEVHVLAVNPDETLITEGCELAFHADDEEMTKVPGTFLADEGLWQFVIPADVTAGLFGRYWYCVMRNGENLCFKEPIYLV